MSKKHSKSNIFLIILLVILIIAVIGFGGYFVWKVEKDSKQTSSNTSSSSSSASKDNINTQSTELNIRKRIITENNIEEILDKIETELSEDEAYYFAYIAIKYTDSKENIEKYLLNRTVEQLIEQSKKEMKNDGYTLEKFKSEFEESKNATSQKETVEGKLGDYYIKIGEGVVKKDKNGNNVLIVDVSFTNNSDSEQSFMLSISDTAYQDGVQIEPLYYSNVYDSDSQYKQILPGTTYNVKVAYKLSNTNSDVIVKMSELISLSNTKITKTFKIAK